MTDFFFPGCDGAEIWSLLDARCVLRERTHCSFNHGAHTERKKIQISAPDIDFVIKIEWVVEHVGKLICTRMYINLTEKCYFTLTITTRFL